MGRGRRKRNAERGKQKAGSEKRAVEKFMGGSLRARKRSSERMAIALMRRMETERTALVIAGKPDWDGIDAP